MKNDASRGCALCALLLLTSFISCAAASCGRGVKDKYDGYYVYGIDANERKIVYEKYSPSAKGTKGLVDEFIRQLAAEPDEVNMKKAIPDDVSIDEYVISEMGNVILYFDSSYSNYTGTPEILRRAAVVKTLCQIPGVTGVQFFVAGQPLTDSNMDAIGIMTAEDFVDNTDDESLYAVSVPITVYFADYKGTRLARMSAEARYDASIPLERLAIEILIKGPYSIEGINKKSVLPTMPEGVKLNKMTIKENTCYIDLSSEFLNKRKSITADVAIYSVVNTLVEFSGVNRVQFLIDGKQVLEYNGEENFGEPFERNLDLVDPDVPVGKNLEIKEEF